jgi:hypothetical protein
MGTSILPYLNVWIGILMSGTPVNKLTGIAPNVPRLATLGLAVVGGGSVCAHILFMQSKHKISNVFISYIDFLSV